MSSFPPLHQLIVATVVGVGTAYYCFNEPLKEWNRVQLELAEERRIQQEQAQAASTSAPSSTQNSSRPS
eukprot:m.182882 g.182882  ORF g.182882 m.182882 type:complete len:69 (-) comp16890_c0_seq3:153-359(-)